MRARTTSRSYKGLALLALLPLAAALAALVPNWDHDGSGQIEAAGSPSVDLSMEVVGSPGCDTNADPPEGSCDAPAGTFTVRVNLNSLDGLPDADGDTESGYKGVQIRLNFSQGVSLREARMIGVWPDCAITAISSTEDSLLMGCVTGIGANESTYLGRVLEADFDCPPTPSTEELALLHGSGASFILDEARGVAMDKDPSPETLTIDCGEPPLPPLPPPSPGAVALDCDASTPGIQSECSYAPSATFGVQIHVTEPPTSGFIRFQATLVWSGPQLGYLPTIDPADEALWPHCDSLARDLRVDHSVSFGCVAGPLPAGDTSIGAVLEFRFRCEEDGTSMIGPTLPDTFFGIAAGGNARPALAGAAVTCGSQFDLAGLGRQELEAINAGDVDRAMALFTENAVLQGTPGCSTPCVGKQAIRLELENLVADDTHSTVVEVDVSGNTLTRRLETTSDSIRESQVDRIIVEETLEFTGDKISSITQRPVLADAQTSTFVASLAAPPLPAQLPATGIAGAAAQDASSPPWYQLAIFGSLLILGGVVVGWGSRRLGGRTIT